MLPKPAFGGNLGNAQPYQNMCNSQETFLKLDIATKNCVRKCFVLGEKRLNGEISNFEAKPNKGYYFKAKVAKKFNTIKAQNCMVLKPADKWTAKCHKDITPHKNYKNKQ